MNLIEFLQLSYQNQRLAEDADLSTENVKVEFGLDFPPSFFGKSRRREDRKLAQMPMM